MTGLIVHEWLEQRGGSESVLEHIADTFPTAPVLVPWSNAPERLQGHRLIESRLARSPLRHSKHVAALALPFVWRTAVPTQQSFDWVIASSHLFAHHVRAGGSNGNAPKFVYAHSPARYLWNPELDSRGRGPARLAAAGLKPLDRHRASEAHRIAANSSFVRERIWKAWKRDADVIHPPVDVAHVRRLAAAPLTSEDQSVVRRLPETFLLGASRFVAYKQLDLVIRAGEATRTPVVIAGAGPEERSLRALAADVSVPVWFVIAPTDALLAHLYERASALVFPALEDFGLMPIEAMAVGTPVIARAAGGTLDTVHPGISGALVRSFDPGSVREALEAVLELDRDTVAASADAFSPERFSLRLRNWVDDGLAER